MSSRCLIPDSFIDYDCESNQQIDVPDEREWFVVLVFQLIFDSVQQLGTPNQHAILVEVVLVQTVHRDIRKQRYRLAFHDVAIQLYVR